MVEGSKHICFYLSDHGFGHAMRNIPLIEETLKRGCYATVVCGERQISSMREILGKDRISYRVKHMDIGLVLKPGTLEVDVDALTVATENYLDGMEKQSQEESVWLLEHDVDAVICDMPLWSIEACRLAKVPLFFIGNFTWTELYREWLPKRIWERYALEYQKIQYAILYGLHNQEMMEFLPKAECKEVSVLARKFHKGEAERIRAQHEKPLVFVALGMSAEFHEKLDVGSLPYDFIVNQGVPLVGNNVKRFDANISNTQDYILASDYVITKAGWGTVAECLLAKKKMALFARDSVLEDRTTIQILEGEHLAVKILPSDLADLEAVIQRMDKEIQMDGFEKYQDSTRDIIDWILNRN